MSFFFVWPGLVTTTTTTTTTRWGKWETRSTLKNASQFGFGSFFCFFFWWHSGRNSHHEFGFNRRCSVFFFSHFFSLFFLSFSYFFPFFLLMSCSNYTDFGPPRFYRVWLGYWRLSIYFYFFKTFLGMFSSFFFKKKTELYNRARSLKRRFPVVNRVLPSYYCFYCHRLHTDHC